MDDLIDKAKEEFDTLWGEAPLGTAKFHKGSAVWAFIEQKMQESYREGKSDGVREYAKEIERLQEKKWIT